MRTVVTALLLAACAPQPRTDVVQAAPLEGWALSAADGEAATDEATEATEDEAPAPTAVTYTLQPRSDGSSLYVVVYNDPAGLASRLGHDHAIAPTSYDGKVTWTQGDPSACAIEIGFDVSQLVVDPGDLRATAKLDPGGAVNDSSKETIKNNFLGKSQLAASQFPKITYTSSSCEAAGDKVNVTGTLSIRGVGKQVTVPMTITADGEAFRASGAFTLTHEDFGFKPFSNLAGALRNQAKLDFSVDVTGKAG